MEIINKMIYSLTQDAHFQLHNQRKHIKNSPILSNKPVKDLYNAFISLKT